MNQWPVNLPAPSLEGYAVAPTELTLRTEMTTGLPRVRRTSVARFEKVEFGLVLTREQVIIFDEWFDSPSGANAGAAWFSMLLDMPSGKAIKMCRFAATYQAARVGKHWRVTAQVEVVSSAQVEPPPPPPPPPPPVWATFFTQANDGTQPVLLPIANMPVINQVVAVPYPVLVGAASIVFGPNGRIDGEDIVFTAIDPSTLPTPATGQTALFLNLDGQLCAKDSTGVITIMELS